MRAGVGKALRPRIRPAQLNIALTGLAWPWGRPVSPEQPRAITERESLPGNAAYAGSPAGTRHRSMRFWRHRLRRRWKETKCLARIVGREILRTKIIDSASALSFWFMLSMIPLLMAVVALVSLLPIRNLVPQLMAEVAILVPASSLAIVEQLLGHLLQPHTAAFSFGVVCYLWSSTSGFTSMISALNIAYDVTEERSWIRDRIQAFLLTFTSGALLSISLLAIVAGPHFADLLSHVVTIPHFVRRLWPVIRIGTVVIAFGIGLELVYFLAPNRRQRFRSTIPGSVLAICLWFGGSYALGFYMHHVADYAQLYEGMGSIFGIMFWVYMTAFIILVGGEVNAEMAKRRDAIFRGHLNEGIEERRRKREAAARKRLRGRAA